MVGRTLLLAAMALAAASGTAAIVAARPTPARGAGPGRAASGTARTGAGRAGGWPTGDRSAAANALLVGAVVALWAAVVVLARALLAEDLALAYVIDQTRPGTSWARRLSGLWSGAEGSLLLFGAIVATGVLAGGRRAPAWQRVGVAAIVAGLAGTSAFGADPFATVARPPAAGRGMAPILEHGAMLIHPPLLYAGFALALTPALVRDRDIAHRLGLAALAVLTAAQAIGASWAYVELGWGGWWAWDPIENVALVVWLLLAAALHTRVLDPELRTGTGLLSAPVLWALCWPAVLAGAALTRTSQRTSVHAFADAAQLAVWLWPLAALAGLGAALRVAEDRPTVPHRGDWPRRAPQALLGLAALVVAAGTYRPFLSGDGTAGWFYSRALFPVAVVALVLAVALPARRWRRSRRPPSMPMVAAHLGMALILVAAVAGIAATESTIRIVEGESAPVDGHEVTLTGIVVEEGERPAVIAEVLVDGRHRLAPSVTLHPERSLRLPELATRSVPWLDTQVILRDVDPDDGALLTIRFRPLNQLVWWGAALVALAAVGAGWSRHHRPPAAAAAEPGPTARRSVERAGVS